MDDNQILQMFKVFTTKQDLTDLEEKIDSKAQKRHDEVLNLFDKQTVILSRLDQERVFASDHIQRLDDAVEKLKVDMEKIKVQLAIA